MSHQRPSSVEGSRPESRHCRLSLRDATKHPRVGLGLHTARTLAFTMLWLGFAMVQPSAAAAETVSAAELLRSERSPQVASDRGKKATAKASAKPRVATKAVIPESGTAASFGAALNALGSKVVLTGYADAMITLSPGKPVTFDQGHANPIIGAHLADGVYGEIELEFEHGGAESLVEYAYVDWRPTSYAALRLGKFLVPVGYFNENLHPSFRNPLVSRPLMTRLLVPSTWADTGIQVRLDLPLSLAVSLKIRAFVSNGLQEQGGDASGGIPALRYNPLDQTNSNKAVGGRIGLEARGAGMRLRLGGSIYHAVVSATRGRTLQMGVLDGAVRIGSLRLVSEVAIVRWQRDSQVAQRYGGYGEATWFWSRAWQTVVRVGRVDEPDLNRVSRRAVGGLRWVVTSLLRVFVEVGAETVNGQTGPAARSMIAFSF